VNESAWIRQEGNTVIVQRKTKNIDWYLSQDGHVETVDKYSMFNEWC
jgi:hypothetical protein